MFFQSPTGAGWNVAAYTETPTSGVRELNLRALAATLRLTQGNCPDPRMTKQFPQLATLAFDGGAHRACFGSMPLPDGLADTAWMILRHGDAHHPDLDGARNVNVLAFSAAGRVGGTIACNDAGIEGLLWGEDGTFTLVGEEQFIAQTEVLCNQARSEEFGGNALQAMLTAERWTIVDDLLIVDLANGDTITARFLGSDVFGQAAVEAGPPVAEEAETGPPRPDETKVEGR